MSFYESPLFVDLLLWAIYALLALTIGLSTWSMVRAFMQRNRNKTAKDVVARRIAWGVTVLLVITLAVTGLFASTQPIIINGQAFFDTLWLWMSDMLINSSITLIAVALVCVLFGMSGIIRKFKS